jgi:outer membrane lipoprotein-sorting protein
MFKCLLHLNALLDITQPTDIFEKKMIKKLFAIILFSTSLNLLAEQTETAPNNNAAANYLAEKIVNLRTYQADFEQRVQNEVGKEIDLSSGVFLIEKSSNNLNN